MSLTENELSSTLARFVIVKIEAALGLSTENMPTSRICLLSVLLCKKIKFNTAQSSVWCDLRANRESQMEHSHS